jgi:hypothetical protein
MENEFPRIPVHGKFGLTCKAILRCLYKRQDGTTGTKDLMKVLRPEQRQKAYEEIQTAVEKLLAAKLVTGKRAVEPGRVFFNKLCLTPKGEIEVIQQRKLPDYIVLDMPRPRRNN